MGLGKHRRPTSLINSNTINNETIAKPGIRKTGERYVLVNPLERPAIKAGFPFAAAILLLNSFTSLPNVTRQTMLESMEMTKPSMPKDAMILVARLWLLSTAMGLGTLGRMSARAAILERVKNSNERMRPMR